MTNAQPEPSMEEILASIRRIISEDEEEHPGLDRSELDRPAPAPASIAAVEVTREPEPVNEQDAALNRMLDMAEAKREHGVTADSRPTEDAPAESGRVASEAQYSATQNHQIDALETGAHGTGAHETHDDNAPDDVDLSEDKANNEITTEDVKMVKQQAVAVQEDDDMIVDTTTAQAASAAFGNLTRSVRVADGEGETLEAIVTEMLRPMVKEWLDANLSRIVEEKVEYEVQRLARRG